MKKMKEMGMDMDTYTYIKHALDLEKQLFTLNRAINWLNSQKGKYDVREKHFEEPSFSPPERSGASDFVEVVLGMVLGFIAGSIGGFILAIIVQIIKACLGMSDVHILRFTFISGISLACFLGLLGIAVKKSDDQGDWLKKYQEEMKVYEKKVKTEKIRVSKERNKLNSLTSVIDLLCKERDNTEKILSKLYALNVLYPKYRNSVAVATFFEYFDSKRCTSLEGHEGAYNIYENEIRLNAIISKLDDIINRLDEIKQSQYEIYQAVNEGNQKASMLYHKTMEMVDTARTIENNTAISVYNGEIVAKNTEIMKYISLYSLMD